MSTKFTPGPWAVGFSDGTGETYITAGDNPARKDKPVVIVSGATDDWGHTQGVKNPADARLIAAAPMLLEALIKCAAQLEIISGMVHDERMALIDARAAIAAATGETK